MTNHNFILIIFILFGFIPTQSQVRFVNESSKYLTEHSRSTLFTGMVDLNGDNFDDIIALDEGNKILVGFYQGHNLPLAFSRSDRKVGNSEEWSLGVGDLDGDGYCEIMTAGIYTSIKVFSYFPETGQYSQTEKYNTNTYGQGCNVVDINGDGHLDFFLSHDQGESRVFINDGTGKLELATGIVDFSTNPESDKSGNYGSEWIDLDDDGILELFMAKCSQFAAEAIDPRRINQLYKKMEDGVYRDIASNLGLADGAQTWTSVFEDVDNDGDLDLLTANHYERHKLYENVNGSFIEREFPVQSNVFSFQIISGDFNNDGWIDFYYTGDTDFFLINKGDFSFNVMENPLEDYKVHAASTGDINRDGFLDLFTTFGRPIVKPGFRKDALWINEANDNHWIALSLVGTDSNASAVGAKVKLYGSWGCQQRNIRGGNGYSVSNSRNLHFGIGDNEAIDSLVIQWPNGNIETFSSPSPDHYYIIEENGCMTPFVSKDSSLISYCKGDTISIPDNLGIQSFEWSDQEVDSVRTRGADNQLYFMARNQENCLIQSEILPLASLDMSSTGLDIQSDIVSVFPGFILSISEEANNIVWSNGSNQPFIKVEDNELYRVIYEDRCSNKIIDSVYITINTFNRLGRSDTIRLGDNYHLELPGDSLLWYADSADIIPVLTGNFLELEEVLRDTFFYVEQIGSSRGNSCNIGGEADLGSGFYLDGNFNPKVYFDVLYDLFLDSFSVYADTVGIRRFYLMDGSGNNIATREQYLEKGKNTIGWNILLSPGTNYHVVSDETVNRETTGNNAPRLLVTNEVTELPLEKDHLFRLNGAKETDAYFYYFDWKITPFLGTSVSERERVEISVRLLDSTLDKEWSKIRIFPNPTTDVLTIQDDSGKLLQGIIRDLSGKILGSKVLIKGEDSIDVSQLPPGIYILQLSDIKATKAFRIIIQ